MIAGFCCLPVNNVGQLSSWWVCLACLLGLLWLRDLYYFAGVCVLVVIVCVLFLFALLWVGVSRG